MSQNKTLKNVSPEIQNKSKIAEKQSKDKTKFAKKKHVRVYANSSWVYGTDDKKWNTVCLPGLGFSILAFGLTLIIIGAVRNIEDLIILGSLFGVGSVIFFVMLYTVVCRPMCQRNVVQTFEKCDSVVQMRPVIDYSVKPDFSEEDYLNSGFEPNEDLISSKDRPQPSEKQLYGERMRSFLATPATTSDIVFHNEGQGTPPPPRVALPSAPGDKKHPVYTMDIDKALETKKKDVSKLELL